MTETISIIVILLIIGVLLLKYLDGDFSYNEEIIHQGDLFNENSRCIGSFFYN